MDHSLRNLLITKHIPFANYIVAQKKRAISSPIHLDELRSVAYFGLVDAAAKYDETQGPFLPYAGIRIRGEINCFLKRHLESTEFVYQEMDKLASIRHERPYRRQQKNDFFNKLTRPLSPQSKRILYLYFICDWNMKMVSEEIGLSEGRISQHIALCRNILRENWVGRKNSLWNEV